MIYNDDNDNDNNDWSTYKDWRVPLVSGIQCIRATRPAEYDDDDDYDNEKGDDNDGDDDDDDGDGDDDDDDYDYDDDDDDNGKPCHYLVSLLSEAIEDGHNEDDKNCDKTNNVPRFKDI